MLEQTVSILDGNNFMLSDDRGDVYPVPRVACGLFSFDTRHLSRWLLTIDGERLNPLSVDDLQYFEARFFLVPGEPTHYVDAKLSIIRHRTLGGSLDEWLTILNHDCEPAILTVRLEVAADFIDPVQLRADDHHRSGQHLITVEENRLRLSYLRGSFRRHTVVSSTAPVEIDDQGLTFRLHIPANSEWSTELHVETQIEGARGVDVRRNITSYRRQRHQEMRENLELMLAQTPKLECECGPLNMAYRRSLEDLCALQYVGVTTAGARLIAGGLPWYMTALGRHSIITCLQAMPFVLNMTPVTLRFLASLQGARLDDFREEEPGKILHEIRYGESAAFEEQPHSPYYGAADSTPLFVVLLDEYERWTGDAGLVRELEFEARAALDWIDSYGDQLGNGYLWYGRRSHEQAVENACWKDSWDAISFRDGRLPGFPRATCELQGYAYDAKVRGARLAREFWADPWYADRLEAEAADLKARFNRDFWVADGEYFALALDAEGAQVDALASNMGHLLWSGIVERDRAGRVAEHLLGDRLFSGWGVRTLAKGEGRYNPIGYHTGTVWPFDNSLIACGLRRYGFDEEAGRITGAMIEAAGFFHGRLPEAFGGYDRARTKYPVQYPTACSPQAWSAGTTLLLLSSMLGLEAHGDYLAVNASVPSELGRIRLYDVPGRWGSIDAFGYGRGQVEVHGKRL